MKIKFLKDHVDYKEGDIVADHPNADYLVILGVAKEFKGEKKPAATPKKTAPIKKAKEGKKPGIS